MRIHITLMNQKIHGFQRRTTSFKLKCDGKPKNVDFSKEQLVKKSFTQANKQRSIFKNLSKKATCFLQKSTYLVSNKNTSPRYPRSSESIESISVKLRITFKSLIYEMQNFLKIGQLELIHIQLQKYQTMLWIKFTLSLMHIQNIEKNLVLLLSSQGQ